jgi:tryptophan synthase beta chain
VGPQHSQLRDSGRATYHEVGDDEALAACHEVSRLEGIIPALESSHALAFARRQLLSRPESDALIIINLSGRGDKDMAGLEDDAS